MLSLRAAALSALAALSVGCGSETGESEATSSSSGDQSSAAVPAAALRSKAPRFRGPGLEGSVVVAARRRDGGPAADLYELSGKPLRVRRLTHNSDRDGITTLNATRDGTALSTIPPGASQEVRLYDPEIPSGLGRRIGRGFEGSVGPGARTAAVLRRSPGPSGLPLLIALKPLQGSGSEKIVVRERRELGGPSWTASGDLLVPVSSRKGSEILVRSDGRTRPSIPLPKGFHASIVLPGTGGRIAAVDATAQISVFIDGHGNARAAPLPNSQVLAWAPDGRSVLVATNQRRRLQRYDLKSGRLTLIADLPDGDVYQGAWGRLATAR